MSSHVGMLITDMSSALLSSSGRTFFFFFFASFHHYKAFPCLELWYFVLRIFKKILSGFVPTVCKWKFWHQHQQGKYPSLVSTAKPKPLLFFTSDAQCVSPQISKWFWGLKGKVLKYFSTGGLIPRLGTSTSIPWVQSTAQGKKERKEMGSLRICILRGKRSKNWWSCLQHRSSVKTFRRRHFISLHIFYY